jgi:hypothetical protein
MNAAALSDFQSRFAAALLGEPSDADPSLAALVAQPGFAVYRNGVLKSAVDALRANYPAVARLTGEDWFRAAAAEFVRQRPPASPMLIEYGAGFADFLAGFGPANDLPYLAAVARLDRMWTEAHVAADAPVLDGAALARLPHDMLAATVLDVHPAARWAWFGDTPAYTLWDRNRSTGEFDAGIEWVGEGILLTRPRSQVVWTRLGRGGCAFLDACRAGDGLALAAQAALDSDPDIDPSGLMQTLSTAGAIRALRPPRPSTENRDHEYD